MNLINNIHYGYERMKHHITILLRMSNNYSKIEQRQIQFDMNESLEERAGIKHLVAVASNYNSNSLDLSMETITGLGTLDSLQLRRGPSQTNLE